MSRNLSSVSDDRVIDFDRILIESVEEGIRHILSHSSETLFAFIKSNHRLKKDEIARNPKKFESALMELFGASLAQVLERHILMILHTKLHLEFVDTGDYQFVQCVKELRKKMDNREPLSLINEHQKGRLDSCTMPNSYEPF